MVARETSLAQGLTVVLPSAPDGSKIDALARYAELLVSEAIPAGFLGPEEADRVVSRHILESAALLPHLPRCAAVAEDDRKSSPQLPQGYPPVQEDRLVDVGSGAGLPGVVLAILSGRPTTFVESQRKRAAFLEQVCVEVGLDAEVLAERAENVGRTDLREASGTVVARALAEPAVALELCLPLVRLGGAAVIPTSRAAVDDASADRVARMLGGGSPEWVTFAVPGLDEDRWAMIVRKLSRSPDRFPRRPGIPKKRPLA